jgi:hypothetical protein
MSPDERRVLRHYYALRWWERDGGRPGDVTAADVQAVLDKYEPAEADLRAYRKARAEGTLPAYFASRAAYLKRTFGDDKLFAAQAAGGARA